MITTNPTAANGGTKHWPELKRSRNLDLLPRPRPVSTAYVSFPSRLSRLSSDRPTAGYVENRRRRTDEVERRSELHRYLCLSGQSFPRKRVCACERGSEEGQWDTCCLTAGHREANSLSRIRSRARDVSGEDIECSVKCAVISRRIHSRCFRRLSPRWEDRGDRIASKNCAEEE